MLKQSARSAGLGLPHLSGVLLSICVYAHCAAAPAAPLSAEEIIQTREISQPAVSPDGRYIAFLVEARSVETNSVRLTWYVERLAPRPVKARVVADGGVPIRASYGPLLTVPASWSPDSQWIYFEARRKGQVQVWRASRRGGTVQQITHDCANVKSFVLSPNGRVLYYTAGTPRKEIERAERREYERGVLLTSTIEVYEPVLYNQRNDDGSRTTQRRGKTHTFELLDHGSPRVRVVELGQPAHDATAAERAEYKRLAAADANEVYGLTYGLYSDHGGEHLGVAKGVATVFWRGLMSPLGSVNSQRILYRLSMIRHKLETPCNAPACRQYVGYFSAPYWRPGSDEVVWASQSELGATALDAWNVDKNTIRTIILSNAKLGGTAGVERLVLMGCPLIVSAAICVTSDSEAPPELQEINLDTGTQQVLFDPNRDLRSAIRSQRFEVRRMSWRDGWGKRHVGVLVLPPRWNGHTRLPLIIAGYHCGGFLEGESGRTVSSFVLAEAGFAVLCSDMNFRLGTAGEYPGRTFGPGNDLRDLQIMLDSWESGVEYLSKAKIIDGSRIGAAGLSFGSEAVWYALTHATFVRAATVSGPPWMDPFNYFMYGTAIFDQFADRGMPDPTDPGATRFYTLASGALNVRKIRAPVLVEAPEAEYISGMETYTEMTRFKKPYEVYVFQDEYHNPEQPARILTIQERNRDWFRFWLEGYEIPGASKRRQYERWENLCRLQSSEHDSPRYRCSANEAD